MEKIPYANYSEPSCADNQKFTMLIKRRLLGLRILFIVFILIVITIGELGRLGYLQDSREISLWVQGAQGILLLIWMVHHIRSINQIKKILLVKNRQYIDLQSAKNETFLFLLLSVLLMMAMVSASISNNCFVVCSCLCISIWYLYSKCKNRKGCNCGDSQ